MLWRCPRNQNASLCGQADEARADLYAIHDELEIIQQQLARLPTRRDMARIAVIAVLAGAALVVAAVELFGRGL
jgi:hypothetical protein